MAPGVVAYVERSKLVTKLITLENSMYAVSRKQLKGFWNRADLSFRTVIATILLSTVVIRNTP